MAGEARTHPGFVGAACPVRWWVTLLRELLPGGCGRRVSATFGRADPRPGEPHLFRAMRRTFLHSSRAAPRSPNVGSWMVRAVEAVGVSVEVFEVPRTVSCSVLWSSSSSRTWWRRRSSRFSPRLVWGPTAHLEQSPEAHHVGSLMWVWWLPLSHGNLDIISTNPLPGDTCPRVHASVYGDFWKSFLVLVREGVLGS